MPRGIPKNKIHKGWFKNGHIMDSSVREKIRKGLTGIKRSEETRKKDSLSKIGDKNPMWGKNGEKHHNWQGGKSFKPYTTDWTKTLRRSIRERDKYVCQFCSKQQGDIALDVHHIDYNKKNCSPNNLITLCRTCNVKANFNKEKWIKYFHKKMDTQFS